MSDCSKIRYASRGAAPTAMRAIARKYRQRDRVAQRARTAAALAEAAPHVKVGKPDPTGVGEGMN